MMSKSFVKRYFLPGLVFAIVLMLGLYAVGTGKDLYDKNLNLRQQQLLPRIVKRIETDLIHSLAATHTLAQEVHRSNGSFSGFDRYAASMTGSFPQVSTFHLAPQGEGSQTYPAVDSYFLIAPNVLQREHHANATKTALRQADVAVTEPYALTNGNLAVTAWNPVYLTDLGMDQFWGFTGVTVLIERLLEASDISALRDMESEYQLTWLDPVTNTASLIHSTANWNDDETISAVINLPQNGQWLFSIAACSTVKQWQLIIGYLLSFVFAWWAAAYFRSADVLRNKLRQLVDRRTRELNHIAYHDNLTDLPNHRRFFSILDSELARCCEPGKPLTVVLIDLDLFSEINDAFGQHGGDTLLRLASYRIRQCVPSDSAVARWGDDEFIVLLKDHSEQEVRIMINHLAQSLGESCRINGVDVDVSACLGIASTGGETTCANDLLSRAQQALSRAKTIGRNEVCWYSEEMHRARRRRLQLQTDLKSAISQNELELYFQPIVAGRTMRIDKAECLLRWRHPQLGMVSPVEFVPLAEETGLIREIGDWVFEQAVLTVKHWRKEYNPDICISVNVSPVQLNRQGIVKAWVDLLTEHGVSGEAILVEITEGTLLEKNTAAYAQIEELRKAGIMLALDDFGTGYSSMSYLKDFNFDFVKIDRSFVSNLVESKENMILCNAIIAIADKLNIDVVAEGVETKEQHDLLTAAGSDYSQGYYFSKPVSSIEFVEKFLRNEERLVA